MQTNNHSFIRSFIRSCIHSTNLQLYGNLPRWGTSPMKTRSLDGAAILYPLGLQGVLLTSALAREGGRWQPGLTAF